MDTEFLIKGMADLLEESPESQPEPKPERVLMVPDTKYKKVKTELAEANRKVRRLKEENNSLVLYIKTLEAERGRRGA